MSQAELAKRLGLTKITILRYENGKTKIPMRFEMALRDLERQEK
jgi:transcriptional regulator with XRE-family HTH domain